MNIYFVKILVLVSLFVALCVKGGQICSAGGVMAMTRLVEPMRIVPVAPYEPRSAAQDFRGISPRPDLTERITPSRRVVKTPARLPVSKASNPPGKSGSSPSAKDSAKKAGKKG
ncbi:hypothetical protein JCM15519_30140 [Fundidesulfovibrio butyratiphilus]